MRNRGIVTAVVVGLLSPVLALAQSSGAERSNSARPRAAKQTKNAAIKLLRKDLVEPIIWEDISFEDVIQWLRDQGDANVVVNFSALEVVGVSREATLDGLSLRGVKVADVLNEVLDQLVQQGGEEISYRGVGNTLRISTKQDFNRKLYMRFYDVTELLFRVPDNIDAPEVDLTQIQQSGGGGGGGGGGGQGVPVFTENGGSSSQDNREVTDEEVKQRMEELRVVIEDSIEPESWDVLGGRGTIRSYNRTLVVRNSVEVHEQIVGFFSLGH